MPSIDTNTTRYLEYRHYLSTLTGGFARNKLKQNSMPIYMDRHDVSEAVTAEHVAKLHQEDLKVQDQFGCRGLTYWFDDKRKTAFCLVEAPDRESLEAMHSKAHGQMPHSIIEVDADIVESFLGRIEDPAKPRDQVLNIIDDPAFRTIMLMEIQDLRPLSGTPDPLQASYSRFTDALPGILDSYAGSMIRQGNSHYLSSFRVVSNAVHAAIDLHALFSHITGHLTTAKLRMKFGITAGVPVTEKKQFFEDCIRGAESLCHITGADIIVTSEVRDLYNNENTRPLSLSHQVMALSKADEKFMTRLMEYTEKYWNEAEQNAENFSRTMGCSNSQLYRKMIRLTGQSPNIYIKEYRLLQALKLLNQRAGNVSEIAFETGFSSPSYFSKCFQKRFGVAPSDYTPEGSLHT